MLLDLSHRKFGLVQLFFKTIKFLIVLPFYFIFRPRWLFGDKDLREI